MSFEPSRGEKHERVILPKLQKTLLLRGKSFSDGGHGYRYCRNNRHLHSLDTDDTPSFIKQRSMKKQSA